MRSPKFDPTLTGQEGDIQITWELNPEDSDWWDVYKHVREDGEWWSERVATVITETLAEGVRDLCVTGTVPSAKLPDTQYKVDRVDVVEINAPQWYDREDFRQYLNDPRHRMATWHLRGQTTDNWSDAFVTYDGGEGSNSDLPEDIWAEICRICEELRVEYSLVWLKNLEI